MLREYGRIYPMPQPANPSVAHQSVTLDSEWRAFAKLGARMWGKTGAPLSRQGLSQQDVNDHMAYMRSCRRFLRVPMLEAQQSNARRRVVASMKRLSPSE